MKIIIIGFGKMGNSHFNSFINSKKNYEIDVVDPDNYNFKKKKNVNFFNKIPKSKKYNLAIIATTSGIRFKVVRDLLKCNKVDFLLLEKFVFPRIIEYQKALKLFNKTGTKVMVNTWGKLLAARIIKITGNRKNKKIIDFNFVNSEGDLIANLPHFLEFINFFYDKNLIINIDKIKKIINSKWKGYKDFLGTISIKNKHLSANIITQKNFVKGKQDILIKFNINNNDFKFILYKDSLCVFYKNKKIVKKYFFPYFSFKTTEKLFYKDFINFKKKRKLEYYNNFKSNSEVSIKIIKLLKHKYKKEILIT